MTKREFENDITTISELVDFCNDEGYDLNIYDEYSRDDWINEGLMDRARGMSWQDLLSELQDIPTGYDYYSYDDGEWSGVDDYDFSDLKDEVEEWMDEWERWDEEEPDEDEPEHYAYAPTAEDMLPPVETGCVFEDVLCSSNDVLTVKHTQDGAAKPLPIF